MKCTTHRSPELLQAAITAVLARYRAWLAAPVGGYRRRYSS